jgi:Holliday junction resolvase RusA-like endonuclease
MPAKRQTQKQRSPKYKAYQKSLYFLAYEQGYELGDAIAIVFGIPMPKSWSKKKKAEHLGTPHRGGSGPDTDNLTKGVKDALTGDDAFVHVNCARKIWIEGPVGYIKIKNLTREEYLPIFDF